MRTSKLANFIKADMPLTDDTDLQKYVIKDIELEALPLRLSAAMLEKGTASVIDFWKIDMNETLSEVNVVRVHTERGSWRYFCHTMGHEILSITDMIVD